MERGPPSQHLLASVNALFSTHPPPFRTRSSLPPFKEHLKTAIRSKFFSQKNPEFRAREFSEAPTLSTAGDFWMMRKSLGNALGTNSGMSAPSAAESPQTKQRTFAFRSSSLLAPSSAWLWPSLFIGKAHCMNQPEFFFFFFFFMRDHSNTEGTSEIQHLKYYPHPNYYESIPFLNSFCNLFCCFYANVRV